jgi:hypothetical protein
MHDHDAVHSLPRDKQLPAIGFEAKFSGSTGSAGARRLSRP